VICDWCAGAADSGFPGYTHMQDVREPRPENCFCKGGTHCDCQHKEPGTAINQEVASSDLAKRINEGLPIV
jgi:hypothetical protein